MTKTIPYRCVGLGLIVVDHLLLTQHYPEPNTKNIVDHYVMQGGGPVPTALAVLGRLGIPGTFISTVGDDEMADFLQHELEQFHVDCSALERHPDRMTAESFVIIDQRNGDRTIFLNRNGSSISDLNEACINHIREAEILHIDGRDIDLCIETAQIARRHNTRVSIDIGSNRPIPEELLQWVDIAIVSETFSEHQIEKSPLKSAKKLLDFGITTAAVTCGAQGSYWASREESFHQRAFPVPVVDTTGAGDVFHGASLYGIMNGYTLRKTAQFASAVSAIVCSHIGGKPGIPDLGQIEHFINTLTVSSEDL
ncbi:MAG: PfkB family carbohydrate kinase [candidate division KSB1 bacterium]|nr:PfkB family carbohydrate kinase [candidate division KSB1 bacterium]